jgi:YD repeat-containing protein
MGRFESAIGVLGCKARSRHATCWLALARCGRCRAVRSRGVVSRGGHGLGWSPLGGSFFTRQIDLLGRTLTSTSPDSGTTTYNYYPLSAPAGSRGKPATITDADGVTITYDYNSEGEQVSVSRPIPLPGGTTATQVTTTENDVVPNITLHGTALGISLL